MKAGRKTGRYKVRNGRKVQAAGNQGRGGRAGRLRAFGRWLFRAGLLGGLGLGISIIFVFFYQYLLSSPHIRMERVVFEGAPAEVQGELAARAGLNARVSLLALKLREVRRKMESHPRVRRVALERQFPHTLFVRVQMYEPAALVRLERMYYMDAHGEVFKAVERGESLDFPVVTGIPAAEQARGQVLKRVGHVLASVTGQIRSLGAKNLSEVHVEDTGGVSLYFEGLDAQVKLSPEAIQDQVRALKKLIAHLRTTGRLRYARLIDFNYGDGAVVSFKNGYQPMKG